MFVSLSLSLPLSLSLSSGHLVSSLLPWVGLLTVFISLEMKGVTLCLRYPPHSRFERIASPFVASVCIRSHRGGIFCSYLSIFYHVSLLWQAGWAVYMYLFRWEDKSP